jgi:hypothetical protein
VSRTRSASSTFEPTTSEAREGGDVWPGDYIASLDTRAINGPSPGRTTAWITTPLHIVDGEPTTDLAHFTLLVDTSNGIAARRPPEDGSFPTWTSRFTSLANRKAFGVGFDTSVTFGPVGHGLSPLSPAIPAYPRLTRNQHDRPVTPEVAGSSPVAPVSRSACK